MHLRDREVDRIIKYAEGLGITVKFELYKRGLPAVACWELSPTPTITIFEYPSLSKTTKALMLLHELGHHLDWIYKGKKDSKRLEDALHRDWDRTPHKDPVLPKSLRKLIYQSEYDGTHYMPVIAKELDLKIPMWKILAEQAFDRWFAKAYLDSGEYPSSTEQGQKRREIRNEYKAKEGLK